MQDPEQRRQRFVTLIAGATMCLATTACGGGDASTVNETDSEAAVAAFKKIKNAASVQRAETIFRGPSGQVDPEIRDQAERIIDALEDESADATIAGADDQTVSVFLREVADRVEGIDPNLAAELDRTRESLSEDAEGGPSVEPQESGESAAVTPDEPPSVLLDLEEKLRAAGYTTRPARADSGIRGPMALGGIAVTGKDAGGGADLPTYVYAYASTSEAQDAYASIPDAIPSEIAGSTVLFGSGAESIAAISAR